MVVNHNGGDLTIECLRSLLATDWPPEALQVVMVDNGSADGGVAERVKADLPAVTVTESGANRGFGGACNLGLRDLSGVDLVGLVNNDATVDPGWLRPLVEALGADGHNGAASPKILFADRFVDVEIESPVRARGRGDRRPLGVRVSGARIDGTDALGRLQLVDGFWGPEHGRPGDGPFQWTGAAARLRVPVRPDGTLPSCQLRLEGFDSATVVATSGGRQQSLAVSADPDWYEIALGGKPFDVLNNVGCSLLAGGFGADRGYQEPDRGQYPAEEVFGWCGAAVLLSKPYLESVGLFEERYFLYYEDLDLSWRGRAQGWRHVYVPESVVRHVHSATTVEGSALVDHYVERNRLLTLTRNAPAGTAGRAVVRHLAVSASYARRDIVSPLAHARAPRRETVRRRSRALVGYLKLLPAALAARRRLRRRQTVADADLMAWMVPDR